MRVATTITDFVAEFEQLGRISAGKWCRATFLTTLAEMTTDPDLIAAAERGREEVLDAAVHVVVATERTTIARVRDDRGIFDVTRGSASGWSCTCSEYGCVHVAAVRQVTK